MDTEYSPNINYRYNSIEEVGRSTIQNMYPTAKHQCVFISPSNQARMNFFNLQIKKRKQAAEKKEQLDMQHRKLKTFYVMKPNLIKELKQKLLKEKLETKRIKKLCRMSISNMMMSYMANKLWRDFNKTKENRLRELRVIWASVVIKFRMKLRLRKLGPIRERFRSNIRHSLIFEA